MTETQLTAPGEASALEESRCALRLRWAAFSRAADMLENSRQAVSWRNVLYEVAGSHVYGLKQEIPTRTSLLVSNGER